jgi:predicted ester cyclase
MTPGELKALRHRFNEEVDRHHNIDAIDELVSPDFIDHVSVPGLPSGVEGLKQRHAALFVAFPDFEIFIAEMIAEGDKVVAPLTVTGTHRAELFGIAPTGRTMSYEGIDIMRVTNGLIVEHWAAFDHLALMQQLGIIPDLGMGAPLTPMP